MSRAPNEAAIRRALTAFPGVAEASVTAVNRGLINASFIVEVDTDGCVERWVLQRLSPIFAPEVNHNLRAVTSHLSARGMATPQLIDTTDGRPWVDLEGEGSWRLLSWVDGATFDAVQSREQASAAGELLGRFHGALATIEHQFVAMRAGVHDLDRHLANLRRALAVGVAHRLFPEVEEVGKELLERSSELRPRHDLVPVIGHGDPKLNNIRFRGESTPDRDVAVCLIDLDTVGPGALAYELGDAWRSWCNVHGEDGSGRVELDLEVFAASLAGYVAGRGRALTVVERSQLVDGVEWISLELAARFAADALTESYFGWDPSRHSGRGEHNLHRARGQLALHRSARNTRRERAKLLEVDP